MPPAVKAGCALLAFLVLLPLTVGALFLLAAISATLIRQLT
jgi:hypothetical protein